MVAVIGSVLFAVTSARIFWGDQIFPFSRPLPFYTYPFLVLTFVGWIIKLLKASSRLATHFHCCKQVRSNKEATFLPKKEIQTYVAPTHAETVSTYWPSDEIMCRHFRAVFIQPTELCRAR